MIERRRFGIHLSSHTDFLLTTTFWSTSVSFVLPWYQIWHAKIIGYHLIFCHLKPCIPCVCELDSTEMSNWVLAHWIGKLNIKLRQGKLDCCENSTLIVFVFFLFDDLSLPLILKLLCWFPKQFTRRNSKFSWI